jgi:hypothetical protein
MVPPAAAAAAAATSLACEASIATIPLNYDSRCYICENKSHNI